MTTESEIEVLKGHIKRWSTFQNGADPELHYPVEDDTPGYNPDCEECGMDWPCPTAVLNNEMEANLNV